MAEQREAQLFGSDGTEDDSQHKEQQEKEKQQIPDETDRKIRVKIDGEERELPLSEVVKGYQKDATASKRLEEASGRKKELDDWETELRAREAQLSRKADDDGDDLGGEEDEVDKAIDALLDGDRSKFKEILKKGRQESSTPTQEELDNLLEQRLSKRDVKHEHAEAQKKFKSEYQDIFEDPTLLSAANDRYYAKLDEGKSITDAMLEAGKETREWLRQKAGVKETTSLEEKQRRKSNLLNLPVTGARSGSRSDDDNTPEDRSSVIADIKKSRGQA